MPRRMKLWIVALDAGRLARPRAHQVPQDHPALERTRGDRQGLLRAVDRQLPAAAAAPRRHRGRGLGRHAVLRPCRLARLPPHRDRDRRRARGLGARQRRPAERRRVQLTNRTGYYTWLCQTVVVVLVAACVWTWAEAHPERAELTVRNTRRTWPLYRSNRQGMLGLWIIVAFVAMALLAPFLANHALLGPRRRHRQAFEPPDGQLLPSHGHRRVGPLDPRRVHLERPHLARRRPHGDDHLVGPRRRHRHRAPVTSAAGPARSSCASPTPSS